MPNPTVRDLHQPGVRQELSIAYMNDREFLAADAIAPIVDVDKQTDYYAEWSRADSMRIQTQQVGPDAPLPIMEYAVSATKYNALRYGGKVFISDVKRANAKNEYELDKAMVAFVQHQILLQREKVVADTLFTTSTWATDSTPSTKWSAASSDPLGDLETGMSTIQGAIGKNPTDLILGEDVWKTLKHHSDITGRITGGSTTDNPARVMPEHLAALIGVKRVTIAAATYNASSAGSAASMSRLYDTNDALLIYRPDSPGQFEPSGAYTFSWSEFDDVRDGAAALGSYRTDDPKGEMLTGESYFVPVVTASAAGYFNEATS